MSKQDIKYTTGLAGEFLVAGELLRRGISAAVTYGNAKKADILAINGSKALSLEVKTTSKSSWLIGNKIPDAADKLWVLVYLPTNEAFSPEYYILTAKELHDLLMPIDAKWREGYRGRHGIEFTGTGVVTLNKTLLSGVDHVNYLGAWQKVKTALEIESENHYPD